MQGPKTISLSSLDYRVKKKSNPAVLGKFCTFFYSFDLHFFEIYFRRLIEEKLLIQIVR